jgi:hypothetical protein
MIEETPGLMNEDLIVLLSRAFEEIFLLSASCDPGRLISTPAVVEHRSIVLAG